MLEIFESQDGSTSIFNNQFGVGYHSKYGAIRESQHVFIEAGLYFSALGKKSLSILEVGFGSGLNAYLTLREADRLGIEIKYTGIERFPLEMELVHQLNYPEKVNGSPGSFERIHSCEWEKEVKISDHFNLHKKQISIEEAELDEPYDVVFYDAFAPSVQPELWEAPVLKIIYACLSPGGILVTYCAKGDFKRTLRSIGFEVEVLKGPPGKREMTRAHKK